MVPPYYITRKNEDKARSPVAMERDGSEGKDEQEERWR